MFKQTVMFLALCGCSDHTLHSLETPQPGKSYSPAETPTLVTDTFTQNQIP